MICVKLYMVDAKGFIEKSPVRYRKKDVRNEGRTDYVHENEGTDDNLPAPKDVFPPRSTSFYKQTHVFCGNADLRFKIPDSKSRAFRPIVNRQSKIGISARVPSPASRIPLAENRRFQIQNSRFQMPSLAANRQSTIENRQSRPESRVPSPESLAPARVCYL